MGVTESRFTRPNMDACEVSQLSELEQGPGFELRLTYSPRRAEETMARLTCVRACGIYSYKNCIAGNLW